MNRQPEYLALDTRGIWLHYVLLLAICLLPGCFSSEEIPGEPVTRDSSKPKEQFFDYQLVETSNGIKQWTLDSSEMLKFSEQEDVLLITVEMDFFREGVHFSTLTADSGRANLQSNNIHTWGNVLVLTDDGRQLETEELFFSNETELITNEVYNVFTRDLDVITGIGLEATPDLEYIEIKQRVEAQVSDQAPESPAAKPESDHH